MPPVSDRNIRRYQKGQILTEDQSLVLIDNNSKDILLDMELPSDWWDGYSSKSITSDARLLYRYVDEVDDGYYRAIGAYEISSCVMTESEPLSQGHFGNKSWLVDSEQLMITDAVNDDQSTALLVYKTGLPNVHATESLLSSKGDYVAPIAVTVAIAGGACALALGWHRAKQNKNKNSLPESKRSIPTDSKPSSKAIHTRYCGKCGATISPDDKFCRNCGCPINSDTQDE